MIHLDVLGIPAPQGSKRHLGNGVMIESSKKVKPWRLAVSTAAASLSLPLITGPVMLTLTFRFLRPKGHYGKRGLRPSAPLHMATRPDCDKLCRSTLDGLQGALLREDSQVVQIVATKRYCTEDEKPGAEIKVTELAP